MYYSALIGKPTDHSVSHVLFSELAKAAALDDPYAHIKIDVEPIMLADSLPAFSTLGFVGINVTLPYKLIIKQYLDSSDDSAIKVGAVNTIKFDNGLSKGYNTDWYGIYTPILKKLEGKTPHLIIVFGTGGAARAAIYAAHMLGARHVYVYYRKNDDNVSDASEELIVNQKILGIELHKYDDLGTHLGDADVIINATSAGMTGSKSALPFAKESIEGTTFENKIFLDAVFNPVETKLIKLFNEQGAYCIDGLWMMLYQAVLAMQVWLDKELTVSDEALEEIHELLSKEVSHV